MPRHVDKTMFNKIIAKELAALIEVVHFSIYFCVMCRRRQKAILQERACQAFLILIRDIGVLLYGAPTVNVAERTFLVVYSKRKFISLLHFCAKM